MPSEDWRRDDERSDDPKPSKDLESVERLRGVGNLHDKIPAGVAISRPEIGASLTWITPSIRAGLSRTTGRIGPEGGS